VDEVIKAKGEDEGGVKARCLGFGWENCRCNDEKKVKNSDNTKCKWGKEGFHLG